MKDNKINWKWCLLDFMSVAGVTAILIFVAFMSGPCSFSAKADPVEPPDQKDNVIDLPRPDWLPGFRAPDVELQAVPETQSRQEVVDRVYSQWKEDNYDRPPTVGGGGGGGHHDDDDDDDDGGGCPPPVPEPATFAMLGLGLAGLAVGGSKH